MNVIITGASKGIGYETVKIFASNPGNNIIAIARNLELLEKLRSECSSKQAGSEVTILPCDLMDEGQIKKLRVRIPGFFSSIDILINCAGLLVNSAFEKFTPEDFDRIFSVNVKSVFRLIQELMPFFKPGSHIVNIGSMGGFQGSSKFRGLSLYSASKGALAVLTECLAEELKDKEITVNCLALGSAQTEMFSKAFPGSKAMLPASQMAEFIADFASVSGKFMNGKIIPVSLGTP
jgi:NAD(P)-dependent dehydrogenase (short-subunit alcohol dehydrogenase family)